MRSDLTTNKCQLFSGTETYLIQVLLGIIALSTLWYKRHVERPKRTLQIWFMDVSKQGIGATFAHFMNVWIAIELPPVTDECVWYFLNFVSDCTLGMIVSIAFLRLQQELAFSLNWLNLQDSGDYGNPPSYRVWFLQLISWVFIILFSKAIVLSVLIASAVPLGTFGDLLFEPLQDFPFAELFLVMVIFPSFLNVIQFWIQDNFLKRDMSVLPPAYARFSRPSHSFEELQIHLLKE